MAYIYKITNQKNGKAYVGKTLETIEARWKEHCKDSKKIENQNRPLYRAFKKYGLDCFIIEELEKTTPEKINDRERYWIEYLGTFKNGYNATLGGDGRAYIDYDLVVKTYNQCQTVKNTAEILQIDPTTVHKILINKNISIKQTSEINRDKFGIKVGMFDKKTLQLLKSFHSYSEAGQYLIDNELSHCKLSTIRTHISEVCSNKRKSAAGFVWKKL